MPASPFPHKDKNDSTKRRPRRWSVVILEILFVAAAVIVVYRLATTGQVAPLLDAQQQYEWAGVYTQNGEYQKALEAYSAAIDQGYTPLARAYFDRGTVHADLEEYTAAIADYTRSIELSPMCDDCHIDYRYRGIAYWRLNRTDAALKDFTQAIDLKPDYLQAYVDRALVQMALGDRRKALADVQNGMFAAAQETIERGIAADQQRTLEIEKEGQQYRLTFSASEGDQIAFTITRATVDVVMLLQSPDGVPLTYDDSEGEAGGDTLSYVIETQGDYTLLIAAYHPVRTGDVVLSMGSKNPDATSALRNLPRIDIDNAAQLTLADSLDTQPASDTLFSATGMMLLERSMDEVYVYHFAEDGTDYNSVPILRESVSAMAVSPDERLMAVAFNKSILIYDTSKGALHQTIRLSDSFPTALTFSPDSSMVTVALNGKVQMYDSLSGSLLTTFVTDAPSGSSLVYSRDGALLALGLDEGRIQIWNVAQKSVLRTLETGKVEDLSAMAFSPNADVIAAGGEARRVQVWDVVSGTLLQTYTEHTRQITDLAFSPSGLLLASASQDGTVRLWDVTAAQSLTVLRHESAVTALAFQADGRTLMTTADDHTLRFWRVAR